MKFSKNLAMCFTCLLMTGANFNVSECMEPDGSLNPLGGGNQTGASDPVVPEDSYVGLPQTSDTTDGGTDGDYGEDLDSSTMDEMAGIENTTNRRAIETGTAVHLSDSFE
jgi:hypothetical protein